MLGQRLQSSILLVVATAACLLLDVFYPPAGVPGVWLLPLLLFFAAGTAIEVTRLMGGCGQPIRKAPAVAGVMLVVLAASAPLAWPLVGGVYPLDCPIGGLGWPVLGAILALAIALVVEMWHWRLAKTPPKPGVVVARTSAAALVILYVGLPMALLVALRQFGSPSFGLAALVMLVATTKSSDIGAYMTGKLLGRHKLIPCISPGKTWEGAFGGLVASVAVAYAFQQWVLPGGAQRGVPPVRGAAIFGVCCAAAGIFGDLCESLIKRDVGSKDSGTLLPGMGGLWDVTDSVLGAALPGYLLFSAGVVG